MFSVIIPLYNKEKFIQETIESVLSQDFKDFEIIVINDGSTDDSVSKLKNISDSRLKIVHQVNQGVGAARNNGMSHANFEWIAFLDGDDIWASNHLSELKQIISTFPSSGMIATNYKLFYSDTDIKIEDKKLKTNIRSIDYFLEPIVWTSATAIKKDVFKNLGGFTDHKNGEDLEYWVRTALNYPTAVSDKITAYYRKNTGGITDSFSETLGRDYYREIKSLASTSPSIELLVNEAKENPAILKHPSKKRYVNSKLLSGVRMFLAKDNIKMAKQLTRLSIPSCSKKYIILLGIRAVPGPVVRKAVAYWESKR
jgi:glycosyltransferase involved in cell wall biosynthesis